MPDYFCSPLWRNDGIDFGDVNLNELPLTQELKDDLWAWAGLYDTFIDMDDPANSPPLTNEQKERFISQGSQLFVRLKTELGDNYLIELGPFLC